MWHLKFETQNSPKFRVLSISLSPSPPSPLQTLVICLFFDLLIKYILSLSHSLYLTHSLQSKFCTTLPVFRRLLTTSSFSKLGKFSSFTITKYEFPISMTVVCSHIVIIKTVITCKLVITSRCYKL